MALTDSFCKNAPTKPKIKYNSAFDALIVYGQKLAKETGQRWTANRTSVYTAVLSASKPITAYAVLDKVAAATNTPMKPASIYRALEALCQLELVVKIESLNAYVACHHPHEKHQHVFLVCNDCGNTCEIADQGVGKHLKQQASQHGFSTMRQVLELHGSCNKCPSE